MVARTMHVNPTLITTMSGTSNSSLLPPPQPGGSVVGEAVAGVDEVETNAASVADGEASDDTTASWRTSCRKNISPGTLGASRQVDVKGANLEAVELPFVVQCPSLFPLLVLVDKFARRGNAERVGRSNGRRWAICDERRGGGRPTCDEALLGGAGRRCEGGRRGRCCRGGRGGADGGGRQRQNSPPTVSLRRSSSHPSSPTTKLSRCSILVPSVSYPRFRRLSTVGCRLERGR